MFDAAGFELLEADARAPDDGRREQLRALGLAPRFETYDEDDLAVLEGWFLLRRP
jgi:hypothetical protein